jgi:hypothetical protein
MRILKVINIQFWRIGHQNAINGRSFPMGNHNALSIIGFIGHAKILCGVLKCYFIFLIAIHTFDKFLS